LKHGESNLHSHSKASFFEVCNLTQVQLKVKCCEPERGREGERGNATEKEGDMEIQLPLYKRTLAVGSFVGFDVKNSFLQGHVPALSGLCTVYITAERI